MMSDSERLPSEDHEGALRTAMRNDGRELLSVAMLSIVAVLTAWCGFQSSKWGGEMSIAFSQASGARIQAADAAGESRTARGYDLTIYATYVEAVATGNEELADYIEQRFTPAFRTAFDAWDASGREEAAPFAREDYVPPGTERAAELSARADAKFDQALENNARGDRYSLLTVLFALVLFLTAMSQRASSGWAARSLLGMGMVVAIAGIGVMLTFPIKI